MEGAGAFSEPFCSGRKIKTHRSGGPGLLYSSKSGRKMSLIHSIDKGYVLGGQARWLSRQFSGGIGHSWQKSVSHTARLKVQW